MQHIDLVPTILDLAGAPKPAGLHGRSLRPLLEGTGTLPDTGIYSEALYSRYHFGWSELYGLTDARYRLVRAPRDELYDLERDPREAASIAAERPQVRQAMRARARDADRARADRRAVRGDRRGSAAARRARLRRRRQPAPSLSLPGDSLADPKDKVGVLEKYRHATDLAGELQFAEAAALYREVLAEDPEMTDVWLQLAEVYTRQGMQAEAVAGVQGNHQAQSEGRRQPDRRGGRRCCVSGKLDEARQHAELAVSVAPAGAHEILAKIALRVATIGRRALREAKLAQEADPTLPMPLYVEGLLPTTRGATRRRSGR